ncbi:hypothetical protein Tco_0964565 [Tanacetum coccineum]
MRTEPASTSAIKWKRQPRQQNSTPIQMSLKDLQTRFETGVQDEQAEEEVQHLPDWFQKPTRLPSPDHTQDPRESFDELTDSTFDFSAFVLNRLNVQTLTPEMPTGSNIRLMKGHLQEF